MRFRWPDDLLAGDVTEGLRDPWAVVAHLTRSGPDVTVQVQEAGGSRTMALGARKPNFSVRRDLRVDPSTIPDIPDGFPPRWGVWRNGPLLSGTLAWHPRARRGGQSTPARPAATAANTSSSWKRPTAPGPRSTPTSRAGEAPGEPSWQQDWEGQRCRHGPPRAKTGRRTGPRGSSPLRRAGTRPGGTTRPPAAVRPGAGRQQLPRPRANRAVRRTARPCRRRARQNPPAQAQAQAQGGGDDVDVDATSRPRTQGASRRPARRSARTARCRPATA